MPRASLPVSSPRALRPSGLAGAGARPTTPAPEWSGDAQTAQPGARRRHHRRGQWVASSAHGRSGGGSPRYQPALEQGRGIFALQQLCGPTAYHPGQQTVDTSPLYSKTRNGSLRPARSRVLTSRLQPCFLPGSLLYLGRLPFPQSEVANSPSLTGPRRSKRGIAARGSERGARKGAKNTRVRRPAAQTPPVPTATASSGSPSAPSWPHPVPCLHEALLGSPVCSECLETRGPGSGPQLCPSGGVTLGRWLHLSEPVSFPGKCRF